MTEGDCSQPFRGEVGLDRVNVPNRNPFCFALSSGQTFAVPVVCRQGPGQRPVATLPSDAHAQ